MNAKELFQKANKIWESYDIKPVLPALRALNEGAMQDVLNTNGNRYYQWSASLLEVLQPHTIVELGGAMGVWDLMLLNANYRDFELYSITLAEQGLEFAYVVDKYSNFHPVVGDDLDLTKWGELDLSKTDLWFFDSFHTGEQLQKELDLYTPFFKKGAVLLFDDIRHPELWPIWDKLAYDKYEATNPLHYSGFGICCI
ncbi:MAG TPA: class I SAM-dependent methyltransferase [Patescibacteria group bacterium]